MKKETHEGSEIRIINGSGQSDTNRSDLVQTNVHYQEALEDQLSELRSEAEGWIKGAAIIGGMIFVGYSLYKLFIENDEKEEFAAPEKEAVLTPVVNNNESSIVRMIKESIALFLIGIAKQKIQDFLQNLEREYENGDTPSASQ